MNIVIGTFTNDAKTYLPALLDSLKRLPGYPLRLVIQDDTIARNMEALRQEFIRSGARWWVFLDHDIQFLDAQTVATAIRAAEEHGWAITGVHATYDPVDMQKPYAQLARGLVAAEQAWLPGYFMLVDSHKIGNIVPDQDIPGNCCVDVAYCAAVRRAGYTLGIAPALVYHVYKGPPPELPLYQESRAFLQARYGNFFEDWLTPEERMPERKRFRFHILGLAYLATRVEHSPCAFTSKLLGLCRMLKSLGHEVTFYGAEGSAVEADETVTCITEAERVGVYGEYDWHKEMFRFGDPMGDEAHRIFNARAVEAINQRKRSGDFLLCQVGYYHQAVADAAGQGMIVVEPGIGHAGVFAPYRVFEAYTWMHYMYGRLGLEDGPWYDAVIPGYYDPEQFPYQEQKGDYFLYIGRIVKRKGVEIAIQVAQAVGKRLIMAGQGDLNSKNEGLHLDPLPAGVEWVGAVEPEERARLMGGAIAVLMPTTYIEPFGAVAVEAQMCGTPIITTDFGAFAETVLHGVTGYRCRTWDDFIFAARQCIAGVIRPVDCRRWAERNFSMDRIRWMYQEYFSKLWDLWTDQRGWYVEHPERVELNWLRKYGPAESQE